MTSDATMEPAVNFPKVARLELMLEYLLEETHEVSLDAHGRQRLRDVSSQALAELGDAVSQDLRNELSRLAKPLDGQSMPSKDELRIIQAQLKGWSLGLMVSARAMRGPSQRPAPSGVAQRES